jgi:protein STE50
LQHDDLKQMGVASVGHRLTILKSVYDIKIKQDIPLESDHYVPLCECCADRGNPSELLTQRTAADAEAQYATATLKDIKQLVEQLRLRDERMSMAEMELRRITQEYARLREDLLPVFRMAKEGQPLPYPSTETNGQNSYNYDRSNAISPPVPTTSSNQSGGDLSRKVSTKMYFEPPKNASPTYNFQSGQERSLMEQALDPTNAAERAVASSSYLAASQPSTSPGHPSPNQPSPTSPPTLGGSTLASRSYRSDQATPARSTFPGDEQYQPSTYSRDSTKPAPSRRAPTPALDTPSGGGGASVEIFKSFRVSMEDPCYKVLPAALKKYNINAPWEQYALYIVYGDKERCLGMEEKPLILFKQLDKEGKKPMFMLRKLAAGSEQQIPDGPGSAGLDRNTGRSHQNQSYDPPGGII